MQEVILRCLEPDAAQRYQSAAHLAFDLRQPAQVRLTARATRLRAAGQVAQVGQLWNARGRSWELQPQHRLSLHVIEASDPAGALLEFAHGNHADLIVLGAQGPDQKRMAWWRSVASGVTTNARCSVHVVRVP